MGKILISSNYGSGWSTWNSEYPEYKECLTNQEIIDMVEAGLEGYLIENRAKELWCRGYWGGAYSLKVYEIAVGESFFITEFEGIETVYKMSEINWLTL